MKNIGDSTDQEKDEAFTKVVSNNGEEETQNQENAGEKDSEINLAKGIPMILLESLCFCISRTGAKYVYEENPEMSTL